MSVTVLTSFEFNGLANYAVKMGVHDDAEHIAKELYRVNVECWNSRYSEDDSTEYTNFSADVEMTQDVYADALYHHWNNSITESLINDPFYPILNKMYHAVYAPTTTDDVQPESKWGYTVGDYVTYKLGGTFHRGYICGFTEGSPSTLYGGDIKQLSGKEVSILTHEFTDSITFRNCCSIELINKCDSRSRMPATQVANAVDLIQKRIDAEVQAHIAQAKKLADERAAFNALVIPHLKLEHKGVLVAHRQVEAEPGSDYIYETKPEDTIILGFSLSSRNGFGELRKAVKNHPELAFMADLDKSHESKVDNAFYIAENTTGPKGWYITKVKFYYTAPADKAKQVPIGKLFFAEDNQTSTKPTTTNDTQPGVTQCSSWNVNKDKNGIELFFDGKPSEETRETLKGGGFRFHRKEAKWYAKLSDVTKSIASRLGCNEFSTPHKPVHSKLPSFFMTV